jgi:hypothetical protein
MPGVCGGCAQQGPGFVASGNRTRGIGSGGHPRTVDVHINALGGERATVAARFIETGHEDAGNGGMMRRDPSREIMAAHRDRAIAIMEEFHARSCFDMALRSRRRGRKSMGEEERKQVSARMKKYWADRKQRQPRPRCGRAG